MISITSCLLALLLTSSALAAPASIASPAAVQNATPTPASGTSVAGTGASATGSAAPAYETVPTISLDPNSPLWNATEPERGSLGGTILGPTDGAIVSQNPDLLAPPTTDHGSVSNAKWPFSLSSMRIQTGGWARQQNGVYRFSQHVPCLKLTFIRQSMLCQLHRVCGRLCSLWFLC